METLPSFPSSKIQQIYFFAFFILIASFLKNKATFASPIPSQANTTIFILTIPLQS